MKLLILILNKTECMTDILSNLMSAGISGATVVSCKGMMRVIGQDSVEPPSIFGSLRELINPDRENGDMLFIALEDGQVEMTKSIIKKHTGELCKPDTGIMFTMPISDIEGVTRK